MAHLLDQSMKVALSSKLLDTEDPMPGRILAQKGLAESLKGRAISNEDVLAWRKQAEARPPNRDDLKDQLKELAQAASGGPPGTTIFREQPE